MRGQAPAREPEFIAGARSFLPAVGRRRTHPPPFLHQICQCLALAALATASYFIISHFVLQSVQVVGVSMAPTLLPSENYLLNRWVYYLHPPKRGDVVVIRDPSGDGFSVKRVIGMSGDQVYLKGGRVYVNGQKLQEPYLAPGTPTFPYAKVEAQAFECGKDQYFVLGDNRKNSADSRTYGLITRPNILGMIVR